MEHQNKRSYFSKFRLFRGKPTLCPAFTNFITESKICQTVYANCEGSYSRRVMDLKDKNTLINFIYCTMYCNGVHTWEDEQDFLKREHVEEIMNKMITVSKEFDLGEEIHFGVVWVYYFTYEDKSQKATPVFKIYKRKEGSEAVFLDASLTLYQSWDNYLDSAEFPLSFLCVPRNGDYYFLGGENDRDSRLDLEFLCSRKLSSNHPSRFSTFLAKGFVPFSQVTLRPWLIKIKSFSVEKVEQIKLIIHILWTNVSKYKGKLFNAVIFGFMVWLKVQEEKDPVEKVLGNLLRDSLMLLNTVVREGSWNDILTHVFNKNIITSTPGFSSCSEARETFSELQSEAKSLVELLRNPHKDWVQILGSFCLIFRKGRPVLMNISTFFPLPRVLRNLIILLSALGKTIETQFMNAPKNSNSRPELNQSEELERKMTLTSTNGTSKTQLNNDQIDSFQSPQHPCKSENTLKVINTIALEKSFSNLPFLETDSAEKIQNQLFEESSDELLERLRQRPTYFPSLSSVLLLEEEDGYGIFLMSRASLPQLTFHVSQLIGKDFSFKPKETNIQEVLLSSGESVGTLFFPFEFSAIGLFSLDAVREQSRMKPFAVEESTKSAIL